MTLSIDDLFTELTPDQVRASFVTELETLGVPASSWRKGGVASTILTVVASSYAGFTGVTARLAKLGFLDSSSGNLLKLLAIYGYGVTPRESTFATGELTLNNAEGGTHTFGAQEALFSNPTTKRTYSNSLPFTLGPLQTGLVIPIQCTESGSLGNSAAGAVTKIETSMLGVSCTNAAAIVGSDPASDDEIRALCRAKAASRSPNGPTDAFRYFAATALRTDGSPVDVNRIGVFRDGTIGRVTVALAGPAGPAAAQDVDAVRSYILKNCKPDTVKVLVVPASVVLVSFTCTVWARADGSTLAEVQAAVDAAIIALQATYPIGGMRKSPFATNGNLYSDRVVAAIIASHPSIFDVDGVSGDTALTVQQVAQISLNMTINQVADGVT